MTKRKPKQRRLDLLVVERGLAPDRRTAQAAIMAGDIAVDGETVVRHAVTVRADARIERVRSKRFVSRGGEKLAHALDAFDIDPAGLVCLDVGASTGGFTDCLLQRGAAHVVAVDVGYGELAYALRRDARVTPLERTHVRDLAALPGRRARPALATVDVSFIGLENVIPSVVRLIAPGARIVALIKPQFQARRNEVERGGVVRDPQVHAKVVGRVVAWAAGQDLRFGGLAVSPLRGPAGNREIFVLWRTPGSSHE